MPRCTPGIAETRRLRFSISVNLLGPTQRFAVIPVGSDVHAQLVHVLGNVMIILDS